MECIVCSVQCQVKKCKGCKMWSVEYGVYTEKCGVWPRVKCRVWSVECGVESVEPGV